MSVSAAPSGDHSGHDLAAVRPELQADRAVARGEQQIGDAGHGPEDRQAVPARRAQADPDLADLGPGQARRDAQRLRQHLDTPAAVVCGEKPDPVSRVAPTTTRPSSQGTM